MSLGLPKPGLQYEMGNEAQTRNALEQADKKNIKTDTVLNSFKMKDTATGVVHTITIASGAWVIS